MENGDLKARAESLANEVRRFADALQKSESKKEGKSRLYKVIRSKITCKVNLSEMVFVIAESDWEAERKAELGGWEAKCIEVQKYELII